MENPYLPYPVTISDIAVENDAKDLKTFKLVFENKEDESRFNYLPGQFAELSLFGKGESPIGIASSPTEQGYLLFTVKKTGLVTNELHNAEVGKKMGVRGPLGKPFPWERLAGKDIVIVGGGFAFTTLRSAITYIMHPDNRRKFKKVTTIYGARSPGELLYKRDLLEWERGSAMDLHVTVDKASDGWKGREGLVPNVLRDAHPSPVNTVALVCGPPIMIRFTMPVLLELGFQGNDILLSLEMRMKCGIGKCGRCNIGHRFVCIDGPVFTWQELQSLPQEY